VSSLDEVAQTQTVSLPFFWKAVVVIGSVASTMILSLVCFAFENVREEWREVRHDIRELRDKVASQPTRVEFGKLLDDLHDIEKRVDRLESEYYAK